MSVIPVGKLCVPQQKVYLCISYSITEDSGFINGNSGFITENIGYITESIGYSLLPKKNIFCIRTSYS